MSLTGALENQNIGGDGFGGFGGGGIIGGLILGSLLNRRGGGLFGGDGGDSASLSADGIAAKTALLVNQNADQNALLQALADNKNQTIAEGRALGAAVCESEKTTLNQFYASAIQAANNTQSIKDQATGFAIVNDKRFDDVTTQIANTTAAILSRINDVENQNLRDQLFESRRGRDRSDFEISIQNTNSNTNAQFQAQAQAQLQRELDDHRRRYENREIEINNINTNTNVQAQLQAQAQAQAFRDLDHNRRFEALINQQNKVGQDIVNIGGLVAANQTSTPTNNTVGK